VELSSQPDSHGSDLQHPALKLRVDILLISFHLQRTATQNTYIHETFFSCSVIPGADKSLARPGSKQARKHARDVRDFNNIEKVSCHQVVFPARQGAEGNSRHSDRTISLFPSWSG